MKKYVVAALGTLIALPAHAGVGKVSSPVVTKGEAKIEYSGSRYSDDDNRDLNNKQGHAYELKYSFTDDFMFGIDVKSRREADTGHEFEGYGFEAQYQMTEQGSSLLNSAINLEYLRTPDASPDELQLELRTSYDYQKARVTANIAVAHEFGDQRKPGLTFNSAVQGRYAINSYVAPGVEWHADYGKLSEFTDSDKQEHYIGPILTGNLFKEGPQAVGYTVGYYWGICDKSADNAARVQLSYTYGF